MMENPYKNPVILALAAGVLTIIIMNLINRKKHDDAKTKYKFKIEIIPALVIAGVVGFVTSFYFDEDNISCIGDVLPRGNVEESILKTKLLEIQSNQNLIDRLDDIPDIDNVIF